MKRAVRELHALPHQQLTDLRQFHPVLELLLDERSLCLPLTPVLAQGARPGICISSATTAPRAGIGQRARSGVDLDAVFQGDLDVPPHRLGIEFHTGPRTASSGSPTGAATALP